MGKTKASDFERPIPAQDDEDEATLAAIDEGRRDAKEGRLVPAEQVRNMLPKWITNSSTRKNH